MAKWTAAGLALTMALGGAAALAQDRPSGNGNAGTAADAPASDLSEDAIGGRGAAREGAGVEGAQGAPGGADQAGGPDCPPAASTEDRCRR